MEILTDEPLKPYTTFKIGGPARYFAALRTANEIPEAIKFAAAHRLPILVLGGGSNLLVSDRGIDALVLHPVAGGIEQQSESGDTVLLRAEAAEPWDRVVAHAVDNGLWGIENLSHIPGQPGAALVQNIGAYGQQLSDVFVSAEIVGVADGRRRVISRAECGLAYRKSIFNGSNKGRFVILSITLRLSRVPRPRLGYHDLQAWFDSRRDLEPSLEQIRTAVTAIRDRKFPYPREEKGGNAGSFFKNLTLAPADYDALATRLTSRFGVDARNRLHELRNRSNETSGIRIPTAFLMDLCGLKGLQIGGARVNEAQPLVLVNQGGASAQDVLMLARRVRQTLYTECGVRVEIEPELAGFSRDEIGDLLSLSE